MSDTIAYPPQHRPGFPRQFTAERTVPGLSRPGSTSHGGARRGQSRVERRVAQMIERCEDVIDYSIIAMLGGISIATMAYTTATLLTTSSSFAAATSNAVSGLLITLILVEIARTVHTSDKERAIRKLMLVVIVSGLREVLWMNASAGSGAADGGFGRPLTLAIVTVVLVGLAVAYALVRRSGGGKT